MDARQMTKDVNSIVPHSYLVGGAVRDHLMGRECDDFDFATPLHPDQIEAYIRNGVRPDGTPLHCFTTGKRFGTLGFKLHGEMVEVTTFRTERYTEGNRKPEVEFVKDINHDLSRRDFTINAMAMSEKKLIDPWGGASDLLAQEIRAVGQAMHRFKEDPLRMLRAARFASQFGFNIHQDVEAAALKRSHSILTVHKERWMKEFDKLLLGSAPHKGLDFLARTRVLNYLIPELALQVGYDQNSRWHSETLWQHTLDVVLLTPPDLDLRWAALVHDIAKPFTRTEKPDRSNYIHHDFLGADMVERLARHLKWSNDRREAVKGLVLNHLNDDCPLRQYDNATKQMRGEAS